MQNKFFQFDKQQQKYVFNPKRTPSLRSKLSSVAELRKRPRYMYLRYCMEYTCKCMFVMYISRYVYNYNKKYFLSDTGLETRRKKKLERSGRSWRDGINREMK